MGADSARAPAAYDRGMPSGVWVRRRQGRGCPKQLQHTAAVSCCTILLLYAGELKEPVVVVGAWAVVLVCVCGGGWGRVGYFFKCNRLRAFFHKLGLGQQMY
jgi:hypothetical protein